MPKVEISNKFRTTYRYRRSLRRMGFEHKSSDRWQRNCTAEEVEALRQYCRKKQLEITVFEKNFSRASNYREKFFSSNQGIFGHENYYRCVYCGHIKKKKNITVDHLFPVNKVLRGRFKGVYRKLLKLIKIEDINDTKNLVPACKKCNSRKGTKTGIWLIRGALGKHLWYWILIYLLKLILISVLGYVIFQWCVTGENPAFMMQNLFNRMF